MTVPPNAITQLMARMREQADRIPPGLFAYTRNGLRMAIAAIEDETRELRQAWAEHKGALDTGCAAGEIRHELLDIAAIAMLAYEETFAGSRP